MSNDDWTEFQKTLGGTESDGEKLEVILRKILTDDKYEELNKNFGGTIPFYGKIDRRKTNRSDYQKDYFLFPLYILGVNKSSKPLRNPLKNNELVSAFISGKANRSKTEKEGVESFVCTVNRGQLRHPNELLSVNKLLPFNGPLDRDLLIRLKNAHVINDDGYNYLTNLLSKKFAKDIEEDIETIREIHEQTESLETITNETDDSINSLKPRIEAANSSVTKIGDDIESLKAKADDLHNQFKPVKDKVDALKTGFKNAEESIPDLKKRISELNEAIDDLKTYDFKEKCDSLDEMNERAARLLDRCKPLRMKVQEDFGKPEESQLTIGEIYDRLKYDYDPERILQFLISLKTSQLTLLCGDPGTGKTTFVTEMARALGAKLTIVEVQNNWTDKSDLLGYYNPTHGSCGSYHSTAFLDAIIDADNEEANKKEEDARLHIICLDEMNLSRIEYYFATFLSLLQQEPDKREIRLLPRDVERELTSSNDGKSDSKDPLASYLKFTLPSNVRFVGTLNMDASTQMLSPKVIDRSLFIEFTNKKVAKPKKDSPKTTYYPASIFKEESKGEPEIPEEIKDVASEYINARLKKYAGEMLPFYMSLYELTDQYGEEMVDEKEIPLKEIQFWDTILLTKILPKVDHRFNVNIDKKYELSEKRYQAGVKRGDNNHPFDKSTWSFWE